MRQTDKLRPTLGTNREQFSNTLVLMRQPENEYMNHKLVLNANIKPYYHNHCRPIKEEEKKYMLLYVTDLNWL